MARRRPVLLRARGLDRTEAAVGDSGAAAGGTGDVGARAGRGPVGTGRPSDGPAGGSGSRRRRPAGAAAAAAALNERHPPPARERAGGPRQGATGAGSAVLLTNAIFRLSGDHDGTLIVPCPPKT